jgi:hypothetical protein
VRAQIGEAATRRHTAPIASVTLWAAVCGVAVIVVHAATVDFGARLGSYCSGIVTAAVFVLAAVYAARKYSLWFSVRWLRIAMRLPRPLALRVVLFDRLEAWRTLHITFGMLVMLPFLWHTQAGRATPLERVLEIAVLLLIFSGLIATAIEEILPPRMRKRPNQGVRLQDVEEGFHALYVEAEEAVLGHSEALVQAYLRNVRPILVGSQPSRRKLWATLAGTDPAPRACVRARRMTAELGAEASTYNSLVEIAEHKVRLEHNQFNLLLGARWLMLHRVLVIAASILVTFHVIGVLFFAGV